MQTRERLKAERKRHRTVLAVWLGVLAALTAFFLFITSPYFLIGSVEVIENKYIATEDVLSIADIPNEVNIFRLDVQEIKKRLLSDLRIAEADVRRKFPATVVIRVQERRPIAVVAAQYGFVEVDKKGIVLAVYKNLKQIKVPIITGVKLGNVYVGDEIGQGALKGVIGYLSYLDEGTINRFSEVNIKTPDEFAAYTADSVYILLGKQERLEEKAKLTVDILHEMNEKKINIGYIDLTFMAPVIKLR